MGASRSIERRSRRKLSSRHIHITDRGQMIDHSPTYLSVRRGSTRSIGDKEDEELVSRSLAQILLKSANAWNLVSTFYRNGNEGADEHGMG